jgi:hypothetical protein
MISTNAGDEQEDRIMVSERHQEKDMSRTDDQPASKTEGNDPKPAFMYVHYLAEEKKRLTEQEEPTYPVFLFQLDDSATVESEISAAVVTIRNKGANRLKPGSYGVEWRVYSYVAFVLDIKGHELDEVYFKHQGTSKNHTFDYAGRIASLDNFSAVYYLNERKNKSDKPLGDNEKDIVEWVALHHETGISPRRILNHQSSDPNTGP